MSVLLEVLDIDRPNDFAGASARIDEDHSFLREFSG